MSSLTYQAYVLTNFGRSGKHDDKTMMAIAGMGLAGEAGETVEHVKKFIRDGKPLVGNEAFLLEAGDTLHYLTYLLGKAGYTLEDAMEANVVKLDKRFGR